MDRLCLLVVHITRAHLCYINTAPPNKTLVLHPRMTVLTPNLSQTNVFSIPIPSFKPLVTFADPGGHRTSNLSQVHFQFFFLVHKWHHRQMLLSAQLWKDPSLAADSFGRPLIDQGPPLPAWPLAMWDKELVQNEPTIPSLTLAYSETLFLPGLSTSPAST